MKRLFVLSIAFFLIEGSSAAELTLLNVEQTVAKSEGAEVVSGAEKKISWFNGPAQTEYSVVYIHGFSASRQETAPLSSLVAKALGANLFETRLYGHGLKDNGLAGVSIERWKQDAREALKVGRVLGRKVIVLTASTGATLAMVLSQEEPAFMKGVDSIVMISPNFGLKNSNGEFAGRDLGLGLVRLSEGDFRDWTKDANPQQRKYWTTRYRIEALIPMVRLVFRGRELFLDNQPKPIPANLLTFYCPDDAVVDPKRTLAVHERAVVGAGRRKGLRKVLTRPNADSHTLAGDILAPSRTPSMVKGIVDFVRNTQP